MWEVYRLTDPEGFGRYNTVGQNLCRPQQILAIHRKLTYTYKVGIHNPVWGVGGFKHDLSRLAGCRQDHVAAAPPALLHQVPNTPVVLQVLPLARGLLLMATRTLWQLQRP